MDKIIQILTELGIDFFTNGYQVWLINGRQIRVTNSYVYFGYPKATKESCLSIKNPMLKSWMRGFVGGSQSA
jgi:hypothetical protein